MRTNISKQSVISSLFWKILERGGAQGVSFLVQLILARLLSPEDFGTVAIVIAFVTLANVFVQSGFSISLIQKKDSDELDFSSVFFFNLLLALIIYIIIFFSAPFIARFYSNESLVNIIRVVSLNLLFGVFNSVQNSYIAKHMLFRKQFLSSIISSVISGAIGIILAYMGLGVWALVFQQLALQFIITIVLWFTVKWRPIWKISLKRIKILFSFGSKLLLSSLLTNLQANFRTLLIGRVYTFNSLGYHDKGQSVPNFLTTGLNNAIQSVMLPTYSQYQDNRVKLKSIFRRSMTTSAFIIFPMMIGVAVVAESLVIILLTEKWLPSVPFIRIYSLSMMFSPIHTTNLQAINAMGRSDIFLKLQIHKSFIGLIFLIISIPMGIKAIAISSILTSIASAFINAHPNRTLLDYGYREQIQDLIPSFILSIIMGSIVYMINYLDIVVWLKLIIQVLAGIIIYLGLSKYFKIDTLEYIIQTVKETFYKRRNMKHNINNM